MARKNKTKAQREQAVKNCNVISCRPAVEAVLALREEARERKIKPSRMAALAIEARYLASSDM